MTEDEKSKVNQVLSDLSQLVKNGLVTQEQVLGILGQTKQASGDLNQGLHQKISLQKILYYIGGFIVLLGIVVFIAQFWDSMNQITKAILTLGSAVSAYALGYYFFKVVKSLDFGHAFLVIAAALFPLGIGTTLDTIGIHATKVDGAAINSAILFLIFFTSYISINADIFLPFSVMAGTVFYYTFTQYLFKNVAVMPHFFEYQTLVLGITFLSFGYYFSKTERKFMTNLMYFFGLIWILATALILQGFSPKVNIFWQLIYPFLLVFIFWGSIRLQNKTFLIMATIFTFAEIVKLTTEYFSKSIGWPISLITAGLVIMGIGYMSFELNKRFLKNPNPAPQP